MNIISWSADQNKLQKTLKMARIKSLLLAFVVIGFTNIQVSAQLKKQASSGEIYNQIEKLNFLGTVLFIAAHPDDENTRLISYLVNEKKANTTYLSITRGDGGQNLIGPEISELLGVIRTQELLAARRTDGGNQMFTRANDFGFSKNAEETISIWDDELVKRDVVWAIRNVQPDIVINRFDHRTSGSTHGHHTASAMLSYDLFDKAGDQKVFADQLKYVQPWQPKRLFFNTSWWFYGSQEKFDAADKSNLISFDVGTYFPTLGKSNTEIAAESRSNHKCQGFGSTGTRGTQLEYLELLKGDLPNNKADLFEGINTTWTRVKGGEKIKLILDKVQKEFNFLNPSESVPDLVKAYQLINKLEDVHWKKIKTNEICEIINSCLGLYVEGIASSNTLVRDANTDVNFEVIKRLPGNVILHQIAITPNGIDTTFSKPLDLNTGFTWNTKYTIAKDEPYTSAYWLNEAGSKGMYLVNDQQKIGMPETPKNIKVKFSFLIEGLAYEFTKDLTYKYNDQKEGEVYQPLEIVPELSVKVAENVYIFSNEMPQDIEISVMAHTANQEGTVRLPLPQNWSCEPNIQSFQLKEKGQSVTLKFSVKPPSGQSEIVLHPEVEANGQIYDKQMSKIDYAHIPLQLVFQPASSKLVKLDIKTSGHAVGYIMGAGDQVDESIRQMGYQVTKLNDADLAPEKLKGFDAIVLGVRAFNVVEELKFKKDILFDYVKNGGNLIVQYNVSKPLVTNDIAPFEMTISRERTTVEEAEVRFVSPEHEVLNLPNKITKADFAGWVQERGLYFPDKWDPAFTPILSCNDPSESPKDGGILIAKYGDGNYIYTGYSWFRQLPAGVPGAYRIFANMLSLGKTNKP